MWICTAFSVCYGMYVTKSALCLLAFIFPAFVTPILEDVNEDGDVGDKEEI